MSVSALSVQDFWQHLVLGSALALWSPPMGCSVSILRTPLAVIIQPLQLGSAKGFWSPPQVSSAKARVYVSSVSQMPPTVDSVPAMLLHVRWSSAQAAQPPPTNFFPLAALPGCMGAGTSVLRAPVKWGC
jgi:hypothetical protein